VVMNIDEIRHQIASEDRFITKQQAKMDRMRSLETGVRAGTVSTDLAMFQISIDNAKARIAIMQKQLENMKHG